MVDDALNRELYSEFYSGIHDGRDAAIKEAPYLAKEAGIKKTNYDGLRKPIGVSPLPPGAFGVTYSDKNGDVHGVRINMYIPLLARYIAMAHNKGREWAKRFVYNITKLTTEHELGHVLSSYVAKGEEFDQNTRDIMESIPTYGLFKVAKRLGKKKKAEMIKRLNPYPRSWKIGEDADKAYRSEITGKSGYPALIEDSQKKPLHKTLWDLGKAYVKKFGKGRTPVPSYGPA